MYDNIAKDLREDARYITGFANGRGGKDPQRLIECTTTMLRAAFKIEQEQMWISVKDKLPDLHDDTLEVADEVIEYKVSEPVLCVFNNDEQIVAIYEKDEGDKGYWVDFFGGSCLNSVTHWMELPALPEEEEE